MRRALVLATLAGTFVAAGAIPAAATVDPPNSIGCFGKATIRTWDSHFIENHVFAERKRIMEDPSLTRGARGEELRRLEVRKSRGAYDYSIDSSMASAIVSSSGTAIWEGRVTTVTHNHRGRVWLVVGPIGITLGEWGRSKNESDAPSRDGIKEMPSWLPQLSGKFRLEGYHTGDEGGCSGYIELTLKSSTPMTAPQAAALVLTMLAAGTLTGASVTRKGKKVEPEVARKEAVEILRDEARERGAEEDELPDEGDLDEEAPADD